MFRRLTLAASLVLGLVHAVAQRPTTLHGAGPIFVYPIMAKWTEEYHKLHPEVRIDYIPEGSAVGMAQANTGLLDFGVTDTLFTGSRVDGTGVNVIPFPVIILADVPAYNLPDVHTQLRFTGPVLADIFLGKIKNWDHPSLAAINPGVRLPNRPIVIVYSRKGSDTTDIWTDYLSKVSSEWKSRVGKGAWAKWPAGIEANGDEGVSESILDRTGTLGYIELSNAETKRIPFGSVQNADGVFVSAGVSSIEEAAYSLDKIPADFRLSICDAGGRNAYPIASFSWVLIPAHPRRPSDKVVLMDFLSWATSEGQRFAEELYYAPLPAQLGAKMRSLMLAQLR